jgi:hypothetical protein
MAENDKTFTQADVDRFVAEERRRNEEKATLALKEKDDAIASLTKEAEEAKGLLTQTSEQMKGVEDERNSARTEATRLKVAMEAGLPVALALRLQGDDEDSLKKDAEALSELILKDEGPRDPKLPGPTVPPEEEPSMNDLIRRAAGRD